MTEFKEKVILVLIQYLAVALVVALAGYLFSRSIEHYKAREAVAGELAKQRVKVIADCWSQVFRWEASLRAFIQRTAELQFAHEGSPEQFKAAIQVDLAPMEAKSKEQAFAARNMVEISRFWLGETLYAEFRAYSNRLMDYGTAFVEGDLSRFKALEEEIESSKGNLSKTLGELM